MRIPLALTLYVSLAAALLAQIPTSIADPTSQWSIVHDAGILAHDKQNYQEAVEAFTESWSLATSPEQRGISANDAGQTYRRLGRTKEAREWLERAYVVWKSVPHAGPNLALVCAGLADIYRDSGDYARAEKVLREALSARNHDLVTKEALRNSLGDLLREEGRDPEAKQYFLETLAVAGIPWQERADALSGLADIDRQMKNWDESARRWNDVLDLSRQQKDENSEAVASRGLALMWLEAGKPARAEPLFRRAIWLIENNQTIPRQQLATALSGLATLYRSQDKLALAEDAWSRALQIDTQFFGEVHPQVAWIMEQLADIYSIRGDKERADDYMARAVKVMTDMFGEDSLPAASALVNRATVEQRESENEAAAKDFQRALGIVRTHPELAFLTQTTAQRYAALLKSMHRDKEARELTVLAKSFQ